MQLIYLHPSLIASSQLLTWFDSNNLDVNEITLDCTFKMHDYCDLIITHYRSHYFIMN